MDFTWTAEQADLRRMLRDLTADRCPPSRRREVMGTAGYDDALWSVVGFDLGLLGVAVAEELGGTGGSFIDAAVVIEEAGRGLWPIPVVTALAAIGALSDAGKADDVLAALCGGEQRAAIVVGDEIDTRDDTVTGTARQVRDAAGADRLVVASTDGLWLVDAAATTISPVVGMDPLLRLSDVRFDGVAARRVGDAVDAARAVDVLRVALALEAIGLATECLDVTVAYLKTREQFGRAIGSFQALAHRASDLAVELSAATSTAYYAAWAVADSPAETPVVAPLAKAVCGDAAYRVAAETIQMHGGIGFTWEHEAHLYFKRATALRLLLGDSHQQRRLVADRAQLFKA
ncbi:MAG TPA: acyl-CoA dehydrogenase family protein [Mycobacteriales bacterium]|nr:acyl-CoA dehydrogenase family protein [Mycobacteriales bacterium]